MTALQHTFEAAGLHRPMDGEIRLDGTPVGALGRRKVARVVGVLPQSSTAPDGVRVAELVARGRYPHQGWFGLDEPTTYLDVTHQLELLDLLADLNRERGTTVVMVLHELNLAARYADHLVMMRDGAIVAQGEPALIVDTASIRHVFGLDCRVVDDPVSGTPLVVPIGRRHAA